MQKRKNITEREKRRAELLAHSAHVFAQLGPHATISNLSIPGRSAPTAVFYYFKSKYHLLAEIYNNYWDSILYYVENQVRNIQGPVESAKGFFLSSAAIWNEMRDFFLVADNKDSSHLKNYLKRKKQLLTNSDKRYDELGIQLIETIKESYCQEHPGIYLPVRALPSPAIYHGMIGGIKHPVRKYLKENPEKKAPIEYTKQIIDCLFIGHFPPNPPRITLDDYISNCTLMLNQIRNELIEKLKREWPNIEPAVF